jgi:hypothetical protein
MSTNQRIAVIAFGAVSSAILAGAFYIAMSDRADSALTIPVSVFVAVIIGSAGPALLLRRKGKRPPNQGG